MHLPAIIVHLPLYLRRRSVAHNGKTPPATDEPIRRMASSHVGGTYVHVSMALQPRSCHPVDAPDDHVFKDYIHRDPWMLLHKAVYCVLCFGWVCFMPFIPVFLSSAGFTPATMGVVLALRPVALLVATPLFGRVADTGYRRTVLVGTMIASSLVRASIAFTSSQPLIGALVLIGEALSAPIFCLLDAAILGVLEDTSSTSFYGRTRVWGSIGWGGFAPAAGAIIDGFGEPTCMAVFVFFMIASAAIAWWLPFEHERNCHSRPGGGHAAAAMVRGGAGASSGTAAAGADTSDAAAEHVAPSSQHAASLEGVAAASSPVPARGQHAETSASPSTSAGPQLRGGCADAATKASVSAQPTAPQHGGRASLRPLLDAGVLLLFAAVAIMGMLAAFIGNFQFLFLQGLGAPASLMGLALAFTILSEAPMFVLSPLILARVSTSAVLLASMVAYAVRLVGYSQLTDPYWTLPLELLHGLTFALGWAAASRFVHDLVAPEVAATALAVLASVYSGVGAALGGFVGGAVYAAVGPRALWLCGAGIAVFGVALLAASILRQRSLQKKHAAAAATAPVVRPEEPSGEGRHVELPVPTYGASSAPTIVSDADGDGEQPSEASKDCSLASKAALPSPRFCQSNVVPV